MNINVFVKLILQVGNRDTLTSVAARFDTTPSELTGLNKLNSSFIYPGQQLLVPDKSVSIGEEGDGDGGSGAASLDASGGDRSRKTSSDEITIEEKGKSHFCEIAYTISNLYYK